MKYVFEFGERGGVCSESNIIPTGALAAILASGMVCVFTRNCAKNGKLPVEWKMGKSQSRFYWANETHFVAVSKLDGVKRGSASSFLWKKDRPLTDLDKIVSCLP